MEPRRYYQCTPSASKFLNLSGGNGTTTDQSPKVIPPEWIIWVWQFAICPAAAATQVYCRPECCTTKVQCRLELSPKSKGYIWGSEKVDGDHCIHKDSMANIIRWEVLYGWRSLDSSHWILGSSAGISRCSCSYTISVSIARMSITQNRSSHTRSFKS